MNVFDDPNGSYWSPAKPDAGVKVSDTNTQMILDSQAPGGEFMDVVVRPAG